LDTAQPFCAEQHRRAQIVAQRDRADRQGPRRGAEQRGSNHKPDPHRIVADSDQLGRQGDGGEAVAEPAHTARGVEQEDVAGHGHFDEAVTANQVKDPRRPGIITLCSDCVIFLT